MRCPNCGSGKIRYCDTYDTRTEGEKHIEYCGGFCKECGAELLWEEVFDFKGIENIVVVR